MLKGLLPRCATSKLLALACLAILAGIGAVTNYSEPMSITQIADSPGTKLIRRWEYVEGIPQRIAVFQTVFWEPRDTTSLRDLIANSTLVRDKSVLEIGTGSGLVALCCLRAGATHVVATDVNPNAIENARYNARLLGLSDRLETRLVPLSNPGAFQVCAPGEKFDFIISNPPWEDAQPRSMDEYALYDRNFELLRSIVLGAESRLNEGGRLLLAYGCREAIYELQKFANEHDLSVIRLDPRRLEDLDHVFIPGMLVEVAARKGG